MTSILALALTLMLVTPSEAQIPLDESFNDIKASASFKDLMQSFDLNTKSLVSRHVRYEFVISGKDGAIVESDSQKKSFLIKVGERFFKKQPSEEAGLAFLCHELGHVAGSSGENVSEEEEADYWVTNVCLPHVLKAFPDNSTAKTPFDEQFENRCESRFNSPERARICVRTLKAGFLFRTGYINNELSQAVYFTSDPRRLSCTPIIDNKLPNISQCAFNFMVAGALKLPRPQCTNMVLMSGYYMQQNMSAEALEGIFKKQCAQAVSER